MNDVKRSITIIAVFSVLNSCTTGDLYRTGQEYQRQQCRDGPPSAYEECMARVNKDYGEYERDRRESGTAE